jgi:hypothetical protein
MTQNINIKFTIMTIAGKIKTGFFSSNDVCFNNSAQETNSATNYDQGFRLGLELNGLTNDPYKLTLGADVEGNMI